MTGSNKARKSIRSLQNELRQRQAFLAEAAVKAGEACYDPDFGLCWQVPSPHQEKIGRRYAGHLIPWTSARYAEALLASGTNIPRAAHILERICDHQVLDPALPSYGNFLAVAEWDRAKDTNAIAFLSVSFGNIWMKYRDLLPHRTQERLLAAFHPAAVALVRRAATSYYTNIYLLCIAGKLLLGRILDRPDLLRLAEAEWNAFLDRLSRDNLSEYNAPNYLMVHIQCFLTIRDYATSPKMRRQAEAAIEYELTLFSQDYHRPSGIHAGTMSRAYRHGLVTHEEGSLTMAYALFGEPLPEVYKPQAGAAWFRSDYLPPPRLRKLFLDKHFPFAYSERNVCHWGRETSPKVVERNAYQTDLYSLATQYGVWANYGHYLPFHFTHAGSGSRRSIFFQNEPDYPLIDAWFAQNEDAALGAFFWGIAGYPEFRTWWSEPPFEALQICHLGNRSEMEALLLDGRQWDGNQQPHPGSTVEVTKPEVQVRICFLAPPEGFRSPAMHMHDLLGDTVIHFSYARSDDATTFCDLPPAVLPVLFEIRPGGKEGPWRQRRVTSRAKNGLWRLAVGDLSVTVPLALEARNTLAEAMNPPIKGPFVESPFLTVHNSDDLRKLLHLTQPKPSAPRPGA